MSKITSAHGDRWINLDIFEEEKAQSSWLDKLDYSTFSQISLSKILWTQESKGQELNRSQILMKPSLNKGDISNYSNKKIIYSRWLVRSEISYKEIRTIWETTREQRNWHNELWGGSHHKNILLLRAADLLILDWFAFETEIPRKRV